MARPAAAPRPPCPNPACLAPHVVRNGHLAGRQRYRRRGCGAWFGATEGTPLYRLHTPPAEVARALLVVMRRGSLRAAAGAPGHKYETIGRWRRLAADHAAALDDALARDPGLSAVEVDEFWPFVHRRRGAARRLTRRRRATAGAA